MLGNRWNTAPLSLLLTTIAAAFLSACSLLLDAKPRGGDGGADVAQDRPEGEADGAERDEELPAPCGNGQVDEGEECDDGRDGDPADGCRDDCTFTCRAATQAADCDDGRACTEDRCDADHRCANIAEPEGVVCRAAAGVCDAEETCDGAGRDCPPDSLVTVGVVCRASSGVCDVEEACTGTAAACPPDAFAGVAAACRAARGTCDIEEHCTGSGVGCPVDALGTTAAVCRGAAGACDAAETCDGSSLHCPADSLKPAAETCRGAADVCDAAERCDGTSLHCPADALASTAQTCRAAAGVCDVTERCTGSSAACPADAFRPIGTLCRGAVHVCDPEERCDGTAAACPPDVPSTFRASAVSADQNSTCAIMDFGVVKCWGGNAVGQLGNGTTEESLTPVPVAGITDSVFSVQLGASYACALLATGGVRCWGANTFGNLGNGTTTNSSTPVPVLSLSTGVSSLSVGYQGACALLSGGGVKCWGKNDAGQLGDGTIANRSTPVSVGGLPAGVASLARGFYWTMCVLTSAGGLKCWGRNDTGQIGDGTLSGRMSPVGVAGLSSGVAAVSGGANHTCALLTGGGVKCWGWNDYGQVGDGTTDQRLTPVSVAGLSTGVAAISAGGPHTCALLSTGGVKCWGFNNVGRLGDGTTDNRSTPVDVIGLSTGVAALSSGDAHSCVLLSTGGAKCWGYNEYGQLGDLTTTNRLTPVDVLCQ